MDNEDPELVYTIEYLEEKNKNFRIKLRLGDSYKINHLETSTLVESMFMGDYIYNGIVIKDESRKNVYLSFTCVQEECDDGVSLKPSKTKVKSSWSIFSKARSNTQHPPILLSAKETSGINPKYFFDFVDDSSAIVSGNYRTNSDYFKKGGKHNRKTIKKQRSRKFRRNRVHKTRSKTRK